MARYPAAIWEPIAVNIGGRMTTHLGVVLHCNDAQSLDLRDWFSDPTREVSAHFQVAKDGTTWQYVDTDVQSWCQGDGNADYLSIESQGLASEQATTEQVKAIGGILAWLRATHGIPLQLAERPGDRGFGWHGMGAAAGYPGWGHPACPGVRRDQRQAMLAAAQPQEDDMSADDVKAINAHTDNKISVVLFGDCDANGKPLPPGKNTHPANLTFADARQRRIETAQARQAAQLAALQSAVAQLGAGGSIDYGRVQTAAEAAVRDVLGAIDDTAGGQP